ncbi:hypothetical protein FB451DRAFT_1413320 [Mycena latifolia]|nr:hypothetical protein FB451DRAFT_1413320 [Mycena latifolia]
MEEQPHKKGSGSGFRPQTPASLQRQRGCLDVGKYWCPNSAVMPSPLMCPARPSPRPTSSHTSTTASPPSSPHAVRTPSASPLSRKPRRHLGIGGGQVDLLSAQAQLVGANAQLMTAQAQPAALQAEFATALRARRVPPQRMVSPLPPARPKPVQPSALPCDWRRRPSARLKAPRLPVYRAAPRDISPLVFLLLHMPKASAVLPSTLNTSPPPILPLPVRARENARSRRVSRRRTVRTYSLGRCPAALVSTFTLRQSPAEP